MKTKLYYLFLLVMFFLTSCERTSNVSEAKIIGNFTNGPIIERTIDNHDYININGKYTHSGTCKKCKQERDSITSVIIEAIKENRNSIIWE